MVRRPEGNQRAYTRSGLLTEKKTGGEKSKCGEVSLPSRESTIIIM